MILKSLIMTGEKSIGDTLDANERDYYLSRLNSMLDSWSNERLMIYAISQTSFALTNSQGSYTIGNGGDFNMTRPIGLVDPCFIRDGNGHDTPLTMIDARAYGGLGLKETDGTYPEFIYYDNGFSGTSTATIKFYPEPGTGLSTYISFLSALQTFSTVSMNLLLPPGYQRAIETNFAVESAPGFVTLDKEVIKIARESKATLKSKNAQSPVMRLDYGISGYGRSNILKGP
jgi:hypothetical protein